MAAVNWAYGILGLFLAWVVFCFVAQAFGFSAGVMNYVQEQINKTGISIPQQFIDLQEKVTSYFTGIWGWLGLIVFISFIIYIIISSMRRQPSDMWT